jgi:hypothetical protein
MNVPPAPSSRLPIALIVPQPLNVATPAAKTAPFRKVVTFMFFLLQMVMLIQFITGYAYLLKS